MYHIRLQTLLLLRIEEDYVLQNDKMRKEKERTKTLPACQWKERYKCRLTGNHDKGKKWAGNQVIRGKKNSKIHQDPRSVFLKILPNRENLPLDGVNGTSRSTVGIAGTTFTNEPLSLFGGDCDRDSDKSIDRSTGAELIPFIPYRTRWARFLWSGERGADKSPGVVDGGR